MNRASPELVSLSSKFRTINPVLHMLVGQLSPHWSSTGLTPFLGRRASVGIFAPHETRFVTGVVPEPVPRAPSPHSNIWLLS
ncbi:hypothetical protein AVEN_32113-1 [Araneus ventricosus]|uniref:Uncharacterized protein n=1 Tax=Araneus ventricosus TaxID=182803 RepID=A0A4Y2GEF3_ARAVE|nr:hypothetical protein AVEN_32113-1 [Araneus ventricosus]